MCGDVFICDLIQEAKNKALSLPTEEISQVRFTIGDLTILAEPIMLDRCTAIKELAIQILKTDLYNNLGGLLQLS